MTARRYSFRYRLSSLLCAITLFALLLMLLRSKSLDNVMTAGWIVAIVSLSLVAFIWLQRHRRSVLDVFSSHPKLVAAITVTSVAVGVFLIGRSLPCFPRRIAVGYQTSKFNEVEYPDEKDNLITTVIRFRNLSKGYIWYRGYAAPDVLVQKRRSDGWTMDKWSTEPAQWIRLAPRESGRSFQLGFRRDILEFRVGIRFARWNGTAERIWSRVFQLPMQVQETGGEQTESEPLNANAAERQP